MKKIKSSKLHYIILITIMLLISSFNFLINIAQTKKIEENQEYLFVDKFTCEIEIHPDEDFYLKYNSQDQSLITEENQPLSSELSEKVQNAIAKSPLWIQRKLTDQFKLIDGEPYADLILNSNKKYVDEISFTIAYSSPDNVPSSELIRDNVLSLYDNDKWIKYADIIDYDDYYGDYYSTIRYRIIENEIEKEFEHPKEIYYWYVVHPEITSEDAQYNYGKIWREYLFDHNDLGYPLLREKISNIEYLWDRESYNQPAYRLWKSSINNHPTAIEAVSYWIGKTVPAQAIGDRPNQPNVISHQHNGWCGELQRLAVAAMRTLLIPTIGICDHGGDHVWREFYERGWYQNDNWWSDKGGAVDKPDTYAYGWGKDISAIFAWRGDDSIYDVTSTYVHREDLKTIIFKVTDRKLNPIDGARVTVYTTGPKDITWLKNRMWEALENIWNKLPDFLKGVILESIYERINNRIEEIPNIIDGLNPCIWNYTNCEGKCGFKLGQNRSYIFIIQNGNLRKPYQMAKNNAIRIMENPINKTFEIVFPFAKPIKDKHNIINLPREGLFFHVSYDSMSYQDHTSILWIDDQGEYQKKSNIDFFIVDQINFEKYENGRKYNCYNYLSSEKGNLVIEAENKDYYLIFRNNLRNSKIILNLSLGAEIKDYDLEKVRIVQPSTNIFDIPTYNIGELVRVSGISTKKNKLFINDQQKILISAGQNWYHLWDTSGLIPGIYQVKSICGNYIDQIPIKLIDTTIPKITIISPKDKEILFDSNINITGNTWDNVAINKIEISIDESRFIELNGRESWYYETSLEEIGSHNLILRACDENDLVSYKKIEVYLNKSGQEWGPIINKIYHQPQLPVNSSNIIIYANITSNSPFSPCKIYLYWKENQTIRSYEMFSYADNPVQSRHSEDPKINEPNNPIYGFELGQFPTDREIKYWIVAFDQVNNTRVSNINSLTIG